MSSSLHQMPQFSTNSRLDPTHFSQSRIQEEQTAIQQSEIRDDRSETDTMPNWLIPLVLGYIVAFAILLDNRTWKWCQFFQLQKSIHQQLLKKVLFDIVAKWYPARVSDGCRFRETLALGMVHLDIVFLGGPLNPKSREHNQLANCTRTQTWTADTTTSTGTTQSQIQRGGTMPVDSTILASKSIQNRPQYFVRQNLSTSGGSLNPESRGHNIFLSYNQSCIISSQFRCSEFIPSDTCTRNLDLWESLNPESRGHNVFLLHWLVFHPNSDASLQDRNWGTVLSKTSGISLLGNHWRTMGDQLLGYFWFQMKPLVDISCMRYMI